MCFLDWVLFLIMKHMVLLEILVRTIVGMLLPIQAEIKSTIDLGVALVWHLMIINHQGSEIMHQLQANRILLPFD